MPREADNPSNFLTIPTIPQKNSLAYSGKSSYHGRMSDKKKKKPASLGCLFWIAFILLIIVLFFFNKKNISGILDKTGASDLLSGKKHNVTLNGSDTTPVTPKINTQDEPALVPGNSAPSADETATIKPEKPAVTAPEATPKPAVTESKPVVKTEKPVAKPTVKPAATRKTTLFFVTIDADGRVLRKEVSRDIPQSDSPMSEALNALFKGTVTPESTKGLRSLIPQGTRLLSATVKDGVATINVSDEFQFNQFGIEGYLGQLSQIVFTATAFPTVKSVQFLIEGQRHEYLGAEGVWIGTPLSRDKF